MNIQEDISHIINEIYTSPCDYSDRKTTFAEKYPQFVKDHPILFEMVCTPRFDIDNITELLSKRKKRTWSEAHGDTSYNEHKLHDMYKKQLSKVEYYV